MPCDHQFLIGRHHIEGDFALWSGYLQLLLGVGCRIEIKAPSQESFSATRARIVTEFSPIPAVKTNASSPPSAAASIPAFNPMR